MTTINSTQTGNEILGQLTSGYEGTLDVPTVVESLLFSETGIETNSINEDLSELKDKQTAFQLLESGIRGFGNIMSQIGTAFHDINLMAELSDPTLGTVSVSNDVPEGTYSLEVLNLASKQSVTSGVYASEAELFGAGTLTIETGSMGGVFNGNGDAVSINVTAGMTVTDVIDEINASGAGVTAYKVNTSSGVQIAISSKEAGTNNGFSITVADADGNNADTNGLSALAYNDVTKNMSLGQQGQDAQVLLDGVLLTSKTNDFTNVIDGFDFSINKASPGNPSVISVKPDTGGAKDLLNEFVSAYNSVIEVFEYLKSEAEGEDSKGALFRDADLKMLEKSFKSISEQYVAGYNGNAELNALGVRFTDANDYTIEIDESVLNSALSTNPDAIKNALSQIAVTSDPRVSFISAEDYTAEGSYSPITVTQLASSAKISGGASSSLIIDATSDEFELTVNGESTGLISIAQQTYADYNQLATAIQNAINSSLSDNTVSVTHDGTKFVIDGLTQGSTSTIRWDSSEAGFASATGIFAGLNATGTDLVASVGGEVAIAQGDILEVLTGDVAGLKLKVDADSLGDYGSIDLTDGIATKMDAWSTDLFSSNGLFQGILDKFEENISSKEERLSELTEKTEELTVRYSIQYSQLNSYLISMQQTQSQLQAQFDSWNNGN